MNPELSPDAIELALAKLLSVPVAGKADSLKEYTVGAEVFGRGMRFDPQCDSIVRVEVVQPPEGAPFVLRS
jgi:hypothetical protein